MIAKKSPLILNNFFLLNHRYQFIQPTEVPNIVELTEMYLIDIDFVVQVVDEDLFQLFIKIGVNNTEKALPGYRLFIEGACVFSFDKSVNLSDVDKSNLLHFSGISICINNLRNIIATITTNGLFGKYTLPTIDVNQLLADKNEAIEKQAQSK